MISFQQQSCTCLQVVKRLQTFFFRLELYISNKWNYTFDDLKELETIANSYGRTSQEEGATSSEQSNNTTDDVTDVEFEEVKDRNT